MWLLNAQSRELEYFEGDRIPPYAILSHRWEDEEVTFDDMRRGQGRQKKGYRKIDLTCRSAVHDLFLQDELAQFVWVDTCCIDKNSSAELSEAINRMYAWYENAVVCYAYLVDVNCADLTQFEKSAWFTRGWTLQELLAPSSVLFYDADWGFLGNRWSLRNLIHRATGIDQPALETKFLPEEYSVVSRMSWAARRQTTRLEDQAYSLLGIFRVNMPLIYGEGTKAFRRLQEEVLKVTDDATIFAWQSVSHVTSPSTLFSNSISHFAHLGLLRLPQTTPYRLSFNGAFVSATVELHPICRTSEGDLYMVPLCRTRSSATMGMVLLRREGEENFTRCVTNADDRSLFDANQAYRSHVRQARKVLISHKDVYHLHRRHYSDSSDHLGKCYGFHVNQIEGVASKQNITLLLGTSEGEGRHFRIPPGTFGIAGIVRIEHPYDCLLYFHFGFDDDFNVFCLVSRCIVNRSTKVRKPRISVPRLKIRDVGLHSKYDIMRVIDFLRSESGTSCNMRVDNIELHLMPHKDHKAAFKSPILVKSI